MLSMSLSARMALVGNQVTVPARFMLSPAMRQLNKNNTERICGTNQVMELLRSIRCWRLLLQVCGHASSSPCASITAPYTTHITRYACA